MARLGGADKGLGISFFIHLSPKEEIWAIGERERYLPGCGARTDALNRRSGVVGYDGRAPVAYCLHIACNIRRRRGGRKVLGWADETGRIVEEKIGSGRGDMGLRAGVKIASYSFCKVEVGTPDGVQAGGYEKSVRTELPKYSAYQAFLQLTRLVMGLPEL